MQHKSNYFKNTGGPTPMLHDFVSGVAVLKVRVMVQGDFEFAASANHAADYALVVAAGVSQCVPYPGGSTQLASIENAYRTHHPVAAVS